MKITEVGKEDKPNNNDNKLAITQQPPTPILFIIDNFYNNPMETREYILTQDFKIRGNYPGQRTMSHATEEIKDMIQRWILPFGGKITRFPLEKTDNNYNGAFQYTTSRNRSWFHVVSVALACALLPVVAALILLLLEFVLVLVFVFSLY